MKRNFDSLSHEMSAMTTKKYSTSFSLGIKFLHKDLRKPIHAIYGFVRFADEIVDSFHDYDKHLLFEDFKKQTYDAIQQKISLNPILNSFQWVFHSYNLSLELVNTFLDSMEMDLEKKNYTQVKYDEYILGSAEVVGLMCLKVFVKGDEKQFEALKFEAMKLGAAFQKINFLRDVKSDYYDLGRTYFPGLDMKHFDSESKKEIEEDIQNDFAIGFSGILKLPKESRFGVYMAYTYYYKLFQKIKNTKAELILNERIRITNKKKYSLFVFSYLRHNLNMI